MMGLGLRRMSHCPDFVLPTWLVPEAYLVGSSHYPGKIIISEIAPMFIIHINDCALLLRALFHPLLE